MTARKLGSEVKFEVVVLIGRPVGTPCRDDKDVPKDGEGMGEANRAIEACLIVPSCAGDDDRKDDAEIGTARAGFSEELSPLSVILCVCSS